MSLTCNFSLIFAVIAGLTVAADHHCCMSKKVYGKGLIVTASLNNGSTDPTMTQNSFSFDTNLDRKIQGVNGSIIVMSASGTTYDHYQVIRDFQHMKTYSLSDDGKCSITPLVGEEIPDGCVPKALNHTGTYMIGSTQVNGWYGVIGEQLITMATTVNDCTFVTSTRIGTNPDGSKISQTVELVDVIQYKNSYDQVFDIPKSCQQGSAMVG